MWLEPKLRNLRLRSWPSAWTGTDDKKLRDKSNSTKFSRSEKSMKWWDYIIYKNNEGIYYLVQSYILQFLAEDKYVAVPNIF